MREFLEKNYTDDAIETDDLTIKLVIKALLEVSALCPLQQGRPAGWQWHGWWVLYSLVSWGLPEART